MNVAASFYIKETVNKIKAHDLKSFCVSNIECDTKTGSSKKDVSIT